MQRHSFEHRGFKLSYLDSAPQDNDRPVVLMLHGFPDHALMWAGQFEALQGAGFRVLAPDTLGCGESEIAPQVSDYDRNLVVSDFVALLDHLGIPRAKVVGHDWGAVLAWLMAVNHADRVQQLIAVSVGHPTAYARSGLKQKLMGWYTLFFQLRRIPERVLMSNGPLSLRKLIPLHPEIDEVMQRMRAPGRFTAALNLYRANILGMLLTKLDKTAVPTVGIWSDKDAYLTESQMLGSRKYLQGEWSYERLSGGHWIPLEQPQVLNKLLLKYLEPDAQPARM